jgi:pre-mRNA branch site protein p14
LAPDVSRILYVKSLPFKITSDELYDIFGKFGAVRQIRLGSTAETRGRAYVVYEDIHDAQRALEKLTGFNVMGRYIVVLYHQATGAGAGDKNKLAGSTANKTAAGAVSAPQARLDLQQRRENLEAMKQKFGVTAMEE